MAESKNRSDALISKIKNNKVMSVLITLGFVITALVSLTDAFEKLYSKVAGLGSDDKGFTIEGEILYENGAASVDNVLVTIIWGADRSQEDGGDTSFQSSVISRVDASDNHLTYSLTLTRNPPDELLMDLNGNLLGIGFIIAFNDKNNNGFLDEKDEQVIGGASKNCITYLKGSLQDYNKNRPENSKKIHTLLQLKQGYSLTKSVPPSVHKLPVPFDDLIPIEIKPINIVIPRDRSKIEFPNWT